MYHFFTSAKNSRQIFVYFQYNNICGIHSCPCRSIVYRKVEITVIIHWSYSHHCHIDSQISSVIFRNISINHGNIIAKPSITKLSFITGAMPAVINKVFSLRILFYHLNRLQHQITPYLNLCQFFFPFRKSRIQKGRKSKRNRHINPITALYNLYGLFRCTKLIFVLISEIHEYPPCII